jgi:hypothetical protein
MKTRMTKLILLLLISISAFSKTKTEFTKGKDPIIIEVITNETSIPDALLATKNELLKYKFIATNGMQLESFTATRTTGSHADYYVADVTAKKSNGKVIITITFVKIGTGLLQLQKIADKVKVDMEN